MVKETMPERGVEFAKSTEKKTEGTQADRQDDAYSSEQWEKMNALRRKIAQEKDQEKVKQLKAELLHTLDADDDDADAPAGSGRSVEDLMGDVAQKQDAISAKEKRFTAFANQNRPKKERGLERTAARYEFGFGMELATGKLQTDQLNEFVKALAETTDPEQAQELRTTIKKYLAERDEKYRKKLVSKGVKPDKFPEFLSQPMDTDEAIKERIARHLERLVQERAANLEQFEDDGDAKDEEQQKAA